MDAVAGINARIAQIQQQIASLSTPSTLPPAKLANTASPASAAAFGAELDKAVAAQAGAASTPPGYGKALVNEQGHPLEYKKFGNGKVPLSELSHINEVPGQHLWGPAARSFEAMRAEAAKDGISLRVTDSYRDFERQEKLVKEKGLYSQGGLAATPGTSNHGWGVAVDLDLNAEAQAWMRENAGRFGYVEGVPREPWHWDYVPTR